MRAQLECWDLFAVICYSETYAASWSQVEMCIISYLQEVNVMFGKLDVNHSFTVTYKIESEITHIESMLP